MKKYLSDYPDLIKEWHPTKNGDLLPENFTERSGKQVWWKCPKGEKHEWKTSIGHRVNGTGCPFCIGHNPSETNNLLLTHSELAKEWHPTKNEKLKPEHCSHGSTKKVWWQCHKNKLHEWEARIDSRSRGNGCPFCSGFKTLNYDLFK